MKATILDVAAAAGVSVATVSRVINGNYSVKPATADRVRTAAAQLQYVPNIQARELNQQRSSLVGVIVTDLQQESVRGLLTGIEQELRHKKRPCVCLFPRTGGTGTSLYRRFFCPQRGWDTPPLRKSGQRAKARCQKPAVSFAGGRSRIVSGYGCSAWPAACLPGIGAVIGLHLREK